MMWLTHVLFFIGGFGFGYGVACRAFSRHLDDEIKRIEDLLESQP